MLALAIMLTAWPIGIATALLTQGPIALACGWHWVMYATGIAALVAIVLTVLFYRAPPVQGAPVVEPLRFGLSVRQLVHMSVVGIGWSLFNTCLIVLVSFAPGLLLSAGYESDEVHSVTSLFMWATLISLPLGGRLLSALDNVTPAIIATLVAGTALIAALTAQAVSAKNRGPGLGVFYTWYYLGMTVAPAVAGWLRDSAGTSEAPVLFSAALLISVTIFVGILRALQKRWPIQGGASYE